MNTDRARTDELIDLVSVLMLLQGAILLATTLESLVWALALPGGGGLALLLTGGSAVAILVARARMRGERRRLRRAVYVVEGLIVATFAVGTVLSLVLAHAAMPVLAVLSQFVLPVTVIGLLRRAARPAEVTVPDIVSADVAA
jgi:hypothetical protein